MLMVAMGMMTTMTINDGDSTENLLLIKSKFFFTNYRMGNLVSRKAKAFSLPEKKEQDDRSKPMKWSNSGHKDEISEENNKLTTRALGETSTSW